jgi:hypothetical protein
MQFFFHPGAYSIDRERTKFNMQINNYVFSNNYGEYNRLSQRIMVKWLLKTEGWGDSLSEMASDKGGSKILLTGQDNLYKGLEE